MAGKEQKWLLTHDSHELKKGEVYKGETLPLWLAGKAIPVALEALGRGNGLALAMLH
ncbi:hypothetical protein ACQSIO_000138 [Escherichia coli]